MKVYGKVLHANNSLPVIFEDIKVGLNIVYAW